MPIHDPEQRFHRPIRSAPADHPVSLEGHADAPPPDQSESGWDIRVALDWVHTLVEPLMATGRVIATQHALDIQAGASPVVTSAWLGSLLGAVLGALPPDDPWRKLSARLPGLNQGQVPARAIGVGAWREDGRRFGKWHHAADLAPAHIPGMVDLDGRSPFPLTAGWLSPTGPPVALMESLPNACAALIAIAANGPSAGREATAAVLSEIGTDIIEPTVDGLGSGLGAEPQTPAMAALGSQVFRLSQTAIRWALFRYRCYAPAGWEPAVAQVASHWARRAAAGAVSGDEPVLPAARLSYAQWQARLFDLVEAEVVRPRAAKARFDLPMAPEE